MPLKDRILAILDHSQKVQQAFVADLSEEARTEVGTFEKWSAKDELAHIAYWQEQRAKRWAAEACGEEPPQAPSHFEQANAECFERYCNTPWDEVAAYAAQAQAELLAAVGSLGEERLAAPTSESREQPLWQDIVGTAYTHSLLHVAGYHAKRGRPLLAGQMWQEWGHLVAPLDDSPDWRGLVHYNMACSLALLGNREQALTELRQALAERPSLMAWSKQDADLQPLHDMPEYRALYAPEHWWQALEANPQAEAFADQFMRTLAMCREAVEAFPAAEWREGDTPYQRPVGLALHLVESLHGYCAVKPEESSEQVGLGVDWQDMDSAKLPSQEDLLAYLVEVEKRVARFLAEADLADAEQRFPWTGSTQLGRAAYMLRHTQHHLAEMCLELHCRELPAPQWR